MVFGNTGGTAHKPASAKCNKMKRWGSFNGKSRNTAPTLTACGFVRQDSSLTNQRIWRLDHAARPFILPRMFPVTINEAQLDWQAGPYDGVQLKILNRDEATGGVTVLRKFEKGTIVPAHIHPKANETAYSLEGQWEESGTTYSPGTLFYAPQGEPHGPHIARTDVISLTIFDGPLTVKPVE